jgi:hypothetical protein
MDVLVLVCLASVAAADCQAKNAVASVYAPDPVSGYSQCFRTGLRYAAQSRLVTPGTYPKIMCVPPHAPLTAPGQRRAELIPGE